MNSEENKTVDNTIIIIALTLITGVFTISTNQHAYVEYTSVITITLLMTSILSTLWHQFRKHKRNKIYEQKKEKTLREAEADMEKILEEAKESMRFKAKAFILEKTFNEKKPDPARVKEIISDLIEETSNDKEEHISSKLMAENLAMKIHRNFKEAYLQPINEKNSLINFLLDLSCNKWRYHLFTLGCICFVIHSSLGTFI